MRPYESDRLKARGNLGYLEFIRLLTKLWMDAHPDIPVVPTADRSFVEKYPVITYRLDLRRPLLGEPKPRYREEIPTNPGDPAILIAGQRFQNVVTFTAITQEEPYTAEVLIELFEDFMMEFQPVFKELGASELVYMRRLPDSHDARPAEGINSRTVSYLLTTEKIVKTTVSKLEEIIIDARLSLANEEVYFIANANDATPGSTISVYGANFKIGDKVILRGRKGNVFPANLTTGFYAISNIIQSGSNRKYTLAKIEDDSTYTNISVIYTGSGLICLVKNDNINVNIYDQNSQATPNS